MPGRNSVPSFKLASGTINQRDYSYNLNTVGIGTIFYNTDTSNVEVYHQAGSNVLAWRDLVMNNKEQIDISGSLVVSGDVSFSGFHDLSGVVDQLVKNSATLGEDASFGTIDATDITATGDITATDITATGDITATDITSTGEITATGDITAFYSSSDARLKTNICEIDDYENMIRNVRGVRFNWNKKAQTIGSNVDMSNVEIGVIAQEVEEYIPEIIKKGFEDYKAVRYEKLTPILIECIKDLYKRIEILEKQT